MLTAVLLFFLFKKFCAFETEATVIRVDLCRDRNYKYRDENSRMSKLCYVNLSKRDFGTFVKSTEKFADCTKSPICFFISLI